ncbi:MAG: hypothetical protein ACE15D_04350 [Candidatus Eisenbacteria bacterium]|nr:hypothetical protein [Candidatus Eisenbacteria bacterium]
MPARAKAIDRTTGNVARAAKAASAISILMLAAFLIGERASFSALTWKDWLGLALFPAGVVAGMGIAWWREILGGAIACGSLLAFYLIHGLWLSGRLPNGIFFVLFASPGLLFLVNGLIRYRRSRGR